MKNRKCLICNPGAGKIILIILGFIFVITAPISIIYLIIAIIIHFSSHRKSKNQPISVNDDWRDSL